MMTWDIQQFEDEREKIPMILPESKVHDRHIDLMGYSLGQMSFASSMVTNFVYPSLSQV